MDSDSPTIPASYLAGLAHLTDGADVCMGPCEDGGSVLIEGSGGPRRLLHEVRMSTPSVAADTLALAKEEGLRVGILPTWYDVR